MAHITRHVRRRAPWGGVIEDQEDSMIDPFPIYMVRIEESTGGYSMKCIYICVCVSFPCGMVWHVERLEYS